MRAPFSESRRLLLALALLAVSPLAAAELLVSGAWVRAMPAVSTSTAGYFVVANQGDAPRRITGASSASARHVMMHDMARNAEGLREMKHLHELVVAPGETVTFAPGGRHLMIMGLEPMPAPGDSLPLCLHLDDGGRLCQDFEVRREP